MLAHFFSLNERHSLLFIYQIEKRLVQNSIAITVGSFLWSPGTCQATCGASKINRGLN